MNSDNNQSTNQQPIQVIIEPTTKKIGLRIGWVIVGLVCLMAACIVIGSTISLLAPQYNEALGYSLAIGMSLAAVAGVIIAIIQAIKGKEGTK